MSIMLVDRISRSDARNSTTGRNGMQRRTLFKTVMLGLAVAVSTLARPAESRAQNPVVDPGYDLFQTVSGSASTDPTNPLSSLVGVPLMTYNFGSGAVDVGDTDTIVQRLNQVSAPVGSTGTTSLVVDALQLQSTVNPAIFVTLDTSQTSGGSMNITFTSPTAGTFDSSLTVFYDVRVGGVNGNIVATGSEMFTATNVGWGRTAPAGAVAITGINYLLNGSDTSADFWPTPFVELNPNASHSVTVASYVPEPSTWIMLVTAGLMVPAYARWGRRRA
jgi:hypothetical protein